MTVVLCPKWAQTLAPQILSAPEMWSLSALGFIPTFPLVFSSFPPEHEASQLNRTSSHVLSAFAVHRGSQLSGDILVVTRGVCVLPAPSGLMPGVLLNILQCTGQPPPHRSTKNYWV